jgi:hypothetical protein
MIACPCTSKHQSLKHRETNIEDSGWASCTPNLSLKHNTSQCVGHTYQDNVTNKLRSLIFHAVRSSVNMQGVRSSPSKPCVVPAPGFATLVCPICPSPPAFAWQELPSASNHTKGHKSKYKVSIAESTIRTCRRIKCKVSVTARETFGEQWRNWFWMRN